MGPITYSSAGNYLILRIFAMRIPLAPRKQPLVFAEELFLEGY